MDEAPIGMETTKRMVTMIMMMTGCLVPDVVGDDLMLLQLLQLLLLLLMLLSLAFSKERWVWVAKGPHHSLDCCLLVHCSRLRFLHDSCCDALVYCQRYELGCDLHCAKQCCPLHLLLVCLASDSVSAAVGPRRSSCHE